MKINGRLIKAILDTGSPVTVISRRVYDEMDREFEEEGNRVISVVRKSKLSSLAKGAKRWQRRVNAT